jgi:hypothetical protein
MTRLKMTAILIWAAEADNISYTFSYYMAGVHIYSDRNLNVIWKLTHDGTSQTANDIEKCMKLHVL